MSHYKFRSFIISVLPLLFFTYASSASPEAKPESTPTAAAGDIITIESNLFEVDITRNILIFTGDVNVLSDGLKIDCEKMMVYYRNKPGAQGPEINRTGFEKIVATGNVRIVLPDTGQAMSDMAVYSSTDEKIVLTGNPVLKQGDYKMTGSRITYLLIEKRGIVEGSKDSKAKAFLPQKIDNR